MVDFFELAPGAHVTAVTVEEVARRDLASPFSGWVPGVGHWPE